MTILPCSGDDPEADVLSAAKRALMSGLPIIYPTETLYALGGRALDGEAGRRVRAAKGREEGKPLPLVAAGREQVLALCSAWPDAAERLGACFWPGPLTLVLPSSATVPVEVTAGGGTVAVRVPGLELTRRLCLAAGPLVSTSANVSGHRAPATCAEAAGHLAGAVTLALDAGPRFGRPSTIVDVSSDVPRLLREGAVPWAEVESVLRAAAS
jgi:L-threonylcarbamoyladenylate synthase